jgi:hypothetical protein
VLAPVACILVWAALRRPIDGRWFAFVGQTSEFANGASKAAGGSMAHRLFAWRDWLYYPLQVAFRVLGPAMPLVPFGIRRTVRDQGGRFVLVLLACLGFVSLTWVTRSSLGLDRHFVVVVPLYATFAAQGASALADWATARAGRIFERASLARCVAIGQTFGTALAASALVGFLIVLQTWMGFWIASIERGWPERKVLASYLRSLPGSATIFCDEATIEILSGLDRRRFDRHWVDDPHTWDIVDDVARRQGAAYVATWVRKLQGHSGELLLRAGQVDGDSSSGVAVVRIVADAGRAAR